MGDERIDSPARTISGKGMLPPQDLDAEMSVLGALFLNNELLATIGDVLQDIDFYKQAHSNIYRTMHEMSAMGEPVDLMTITNALKKKGLLEKAGGAAYLAALSSSVATSAHIEAHARIVRDKSILRQTIRVGNQMVTLAHSEMGEPRELVDRFSQEVLQLMNTGSGSEGFVPAGRIVSSSFDLIEKMAESKNLSGLPTGFHDLDKMTGGFQKSDLIIIAGRPAMGKTSLALTMALHAALPVGASEEEQPDDSSHGGPVGIFSLEMSKEQLITRLLCSDARVNISKVRDGYLVESDWPRLTMSAGRLQKAPIYIDDSANIGIMEMKARARRLQMTEPNLALIIIDYLQLMQSGIRADNRQAEISTISRNLKLMAKDLHIPVIALSQLNRNPEGRDTHKPRLSDLRESGSIEQDADVVMMIKRESVYDDDNNLSEEEKCLADLYVEKQRNGPTGSIRLMFLDQYARFESASSRRDM